MPGDMLVWYCPLDRWLAALVDGWRLPMVVSSMQGHHGAHAVLLTRNVESVTPADPIG